MASIQACPLPANALLAKYADVGGYTDCYVLDVAGSVSQATYVEAFYTGKAFKFELFLLGLLFSLPSTDAQARQLAAGERDKFSGWRVEDRNAGQLLLCDLSGKTRSWLMAEPEPRGAALATRLYFGSAVLPARPGPDGEPRMSPFFAPLLWFHKLYSRVLLNSARVRLAHRPLG